MMERPTLRIVLRSICVVSACLLAPSKPHAVYMSITKATALGSLHFLPASATVNLQSMRSHVDCKLTVRLQNGVTFMKKAPFFIIFRIFENVCSVICRGLCLFRCINVE